MSPSSLRLGIRQSLDTKPGCLIFIHDSQNTVQKKKKQKKRSITSAPILHMEREAEKKKAQITGKENQNRSSI